MWSPCHPWCQEPRALGRPRRAAPGEPEVIETKLVAQGDHCRRRSLFRLVRGRKPCPHWSLQRRHFLEAGRRDLVSGRKESWRPRSLTGLAPGGSANRVKVADTPPGASLENGPMSTQLFSAPQSTLCTGGCEDFEFGSSFPHQPLWRHAAGGNSLAIISSISETHPLGCDARRDGWPPTAQGFRSVAGEGRVERPPLGSRPSRLPLADSPPPTVRGPL